MSQKVSGPTTLHPGPAVRDAHLVHLQHLAGRLQPLRCLKLEDCGAVTSVRLSLIVHYPPGLTRLGVTGAPGIGDVDTSCPGCRSCSTWELVGTWVTEACLAHILRLPALRSLNVTECENIPAARLIGMLSSTQAVAMEAAAAAIADHASSREAQCDALVAAGVLPAIVAPLARGSSACQAQAAAAFQYIIDYNRERCAAVVAAGCLPPLVSLLSHASADAVEHAAVVMRHLGDNFNGFAEAIVEALGSAASS